MFFCKNFFVFYQRRRKDFCLLLEPPIYIVAPTTNENPLKFMNKIIVMVA